MKRLLLFFISIALFISASAAVANCEAAGYIYSTDIRAFINDVEVQSYNIGGKTVVVIEDVLNENLQPYVYDDKSRSLRISSLNPYYLIKSDEKEQSLPGRITGLIYKTDIKAYIYDVAVESYNIGGKTAVAIEDLGYDSGFSPIGGRYIWDEEKRTISLEFLYHRAGLSENMNISITVNEGMAAAEAAFEEVLHCGGRQETVRFNDNTIIASDAELIIPIMAEDVIIGYYFRRPSWNNDYIAFTYYYPERVKEAEKSAASAAAKTREDIISHFIGAHSLGEARERFDTDDYTFIYISVAGTSWTAYCLVQAFDDGTYIDYGDIISTRNRSPVNLTIDREKEKVNFKYVDRYTSEWFTNYEIDLKSGKIYPVGG